MFKNESFSLKIKYLKKAVFPKRITPENRGGFLVRPYNSIKEIKCLLYAQLGFYPGDDIPRYINHVRAHGYRCHAPLHQLLRDFRVDRWRLPADRAGHASGFARSAEHTSEL